MGQHGQSNQENIQQYEDLDKCKILVHADELPVECYPTILKFFNILENRIITYIASGSEYCMAIEQKRVIYAWGRNKEGQLGVGGITNFIDRPTKVQGLQGNLMKAIACGEDHTLFLTESGRLFSCGSSKDGKLGLGARNSALMTP